MTTTPKDSTMTDPTPNDGTDSFGVVQVSVPDNRANVDREGDVPVDEVAQTPADLGMEAGK